MKTISEISASGVEFRHSNKSKVSQASLESDLISCNTELVSRLNGCESKRHGPGHFIHKVFLQKLKSKSVPILKGKTEDVSTEAPDDESWFKTWPDCLEKEDKEKPEPEEDKGVVKNGEVASMDTVLLSLPIAYSPITKGIHLVEQKPEETCPRPGNAALSRVSTEAGSFSSTVSSLSDSPLATEDSSSLLPDNDTSSLLSLGACSLASHDSHSEKPKRKGISAFFTSGVWGGWRTRVEPSEGWRLFSKSSPTVGLSSRIPSLTSDKHSDDVVSVGGDSVQGSSGLIPVGRPTGLPDKSCEEKRAHQHQHDSILRFARKRELKEAKHRKKLMQLQLKSEDEAALATRVWTQEILPKWNSLRSSKRTQEMWWGGIPPGVRGRLWNLAITNDLNITRQLYHICLQRAEERLAGGIDCCRTGETDGESSLDLIQLDISRTFPHLCIFQQGGPYYSMLHSLLAAYVCYRPDIGYVQGMSFIAAVLILNMDTPDAFVCFANLLNRPCHRAFYSLDQPTMESYYRAYSELVRENCPKLWAHLESCHLSPDLYLLDWVYTVYAKAMNLDLASRVWDVFLRDGDEFLFRTAIGILLVSEEELMRLDFVSGSKYLTRLPEDLCPQALFKAIATVKMTSSKRTFPQILASYVDS